MRTLFIYRQLANDLVPSFRFFPLLKLFLNCFRILGGGCLQPYHVLLKHLSANPHSIEITRKVAFCRKIEAGRRRKKKSLLSSDFEFSNVIFTKQFQTLCCRLGLSLDIRWQLQRFQLSIIDNLPMFISLKIGLMDTLNFTCNKFGNAHEYSLFKPLAA